MRVGNAGIYRNILAIYGTSFGARCSVFSLQIEIYVTAHIYNTPYNHTTSTHTRTLFYQHFPIGC